MGKLNLDLLKGIEEQETVIDKSKQQETSQNVTQNSSHIHQKPQTTLEQTNSNPNPPKDEKFQNKTNAKSIKAVMGFRAEVEKMENWKIYANVTNQEIGALCTTALEEYIAQHKLTPEQQQLFDLKKQTLETEKKIKGMINS